jgi:pimeloyl-ACP methyl ester carboxylesterase
MNLPTTDGTILNFTEFGKGEPVFMLHGNRQSAKAFTSQIKRLQQTHRLIAIDTRGHGGSAHGNVPLTLDLLARDVLDVADTLNIPAFSILGYSDGANIALKVAMRAPTRITSLILISPNLNPAGLRLPFRLMLKVGLTLLSPAKYGRNLPAIRKLTYLRDKINLMNASYELDHEVLTMPILIISGARDIIHKHHLHLISSLLPHAVLHILSGEGHAILGSQRLNEMICAFLTASDS